MKRNKRMIARLAFVSTVLFLVSIALAFARLPSSEPAYSVAQVRAGLARDPKSWLGRTVLVQDAWQGVYHAHLCSRANRCHRGATWILIGAEEGEGMAASQYSPVTIQSSIVSTNGYTSISGQVMPIRHNRMTLVPDMSALIVLLPSSVEQFNRPGHGGLLDALCGLPFIGPFVTSVCSRNDRVRLHVHLTQSFCPALTGGACVDGVLVTS